jgi:hypothetical protein
VKHDHVIEPALHAGRGLERADRGRPGVDLGIAFVDQQDEIIAPRERDQAPQVREIGRGALRVRWRAQIERGGALEQLGPQIVERRQMAARRGYRQQHRLRAGDRGGAQVHIVEGVGQQDRGRPARLALGHDHLRDHEQGFLGARAGQNVPLGIERAVGQMVATRQPVGDRLAKCRCAADGRIAPPEIPVLLERLCQQLRDRMHRLADREIDRGAPRRRRHGLEQQREPPEHVVAETLQPRIEHGLEAPVNRPPWERQFGRTLTFSGNLFQPSANARET